MGKELYKDEDMPYGVLTGITLFISTREVTVRTFILMHYIYYLLFYLLLGCDIWTDIFTVKLLNMSVFEGNIGFSTNMSIDQVNWSLEKLASIL